METTPVPRSAKADRHVSVINAPGTNPRQALSSLMDWARAQIGTIQDPDDQRACTWVVIHAVDEALATIASGQKPHPWFYSPAGQQLDLAGWKPLVLPAERKGGRT